MPKGPEQVPFEISDRNDEPGEGDGPVAPPAP